MGVKSRTSLDGTYHSREDVICESFPYGEFERASRWESFFLIHHEDDGEGDGDFTFHCDTGSLYIVSFSKFERILL